jgi:hypothetical protein
MDSPPSQPPRSQPTGLLRTSLAAVTSAASWVVQAATPAAPVPVATAPPDPIDSMLDIFRREELAADAASRRGDPPAAASPAGSVALARHHGLPPLTLTNDPASASPLLHHHHHHLHQPPAFAAPVHAWIDLAGAGPMRQQGGFVGATGNETKTLGSRRDDDDDLLGSDLGDVDLTSDKGEPWSSDGAMSSAYMQRHDAGGDRGNNGPGPNA